MRRNTDTEGTMNKIKRNGPKEISMEEDGVAVEATPI
jgi:hypothetical protein